MAFEKDDKPKNEPEMKAPADAPEALPAADFKLELSDREMEALRKKAADTVQAELTKKAKDDFYAAELERLRMEAGISATLCGGINDEMVTIYIDLSDAEDGTADPFIRLNWAEKYEHGHVYTVPRHKANSLMEIMWRGKLHTKQREGKSVFRNRSYNTLLAEQGARVVHRGGTNQHLRLQ